MYLSKPAAGNAEVAKLWYAAGPQSYDPRGRIAARDNLHRLQKKKKKKKKKKKPGV
eukprot:NODE_7951_length_410_cov_169.783099.p4 GENE.NODE_7951_length_410_cov_169.783099~~NODE_7951_length_410_cov_169.783099.p4  ORF type:complete len:56 (+),score=42.19 NODE_7951_length_410_cov_169.783099:197-364(+)